ncbi:MAG TPA: ABC transporter ATP-binding protein [Actinomycetota bacterium]|nr:ABC transporter ATP-binding protein [Actinomycetota bacterium]
MLAARNVTVRYGRVQALTRTSVEVEPGELVVLLGPNGAGKTTMLRVLSGLRRPSEGSVRLDGTDATGRPAEHFAANGVGHIPEGRGIFPRLTVEQNLLVGLYTRRRERVTRRTEVDAVLESFPALKERLDSRAGVLSGGEQQMLALARALIARPKLLLVDEPSHGLAPAIAAHLFDLFDQLRAEGLGILVVEQHAALALRGADRAYVLQKGTITYEGSPSPLVRNRKRLVDVYLGRSP